MAKLAMQILAILLVSAATALSENGWKLEKLDGAAYYSQSEVWHGRFIALNGKAFDVSDLYKPKYQGFYLDGILTYGLRNQGEFVIPFLFDAGYKSALFVATPLLSLGFGYTRTLGNFGFYIGSRHVLKIGGSIKEKPCIDDFSREFHCGTGMAWVDAVRDGIFKKSEIQGSIEFRIAYEF
ncbi:MAG: hypothetical protein OXI87_18545 [Albidovulum sp.]|nr:hypothetical protein [Albidovulum sp.]MDE0530723.1 hypothetical protein [Albidovulum sp.]